MLAVFVIQRKLSTTYDLTELLPPFYKINTNDGFSAILRKPCAFDGDNCEGSFPLADVIFGIIDDVEDTKLLEAKIVLTR